MIDRELLELAVKAAGGITTDGLGGCWDMGNGVGWNPLTDDGDALRLAVKLQMQLYVGTHKVIAEICSDSEFPPILQKVFVESDPYAATRRAIVRAAAKIGKEM